VRTAGKKIKRQQLKGANRRLRLPIHLSTKREGKLGVKGDGRKTGFDEKWERRMQQELG